MSPHDFVRKWQPGGAAHTLTERAGAQAHFIDLCRVLGVPEPADPERYCFERGVAKTGGAGRRTDGFADVWHKGHFAWEYKRPGRSLRDALGQLMMYALPLESPPLLVVCDRVTLEVHTHFTGTPSERHVFAMADLVLPEVQGKLRTLWTNAEAWRPKLTNREITEQAARTFAGTAERLRHAGVPPQEVSHFLTQCVFCFFAEDVGLLPERLFERLMNARVPPAQTAAQLANLLATMRDGGMFGVAAVPWFNGGLFATIAVPPLTEEDVAALRTASGLDWSAIDPSILGTLFERGLDPSKRAQLGAHYTDPATILRLVEPVVTRPLLAEWEALKPSIEKKLERSKKFGDKAWREGQAMFVAFIERLNNYRLLDPACGSGNFLYLGLKALKDVEHQVNFDAESLGLERQLDVTGPHNVLGIELNEYAAELARVTVWIGELQWRIQKGYGFKVNPVLEPLDHIECRDAVLAADGSEAAWPTADVVVGNPPFLGGKKQWAELGVDYSERLRSAYQGRLPAFSDLVCYWFEKARSQIETGALQRAGLVATNSVRGGANREALDRIAATGDIFEAWSDLPWINDGAAVRVSLVGFCKQGLATSRSLDGISVAKINTDLTAGANLVSALRLSESKGAAFMGCVKAGRFDVSREQAAMWMAEPNPHGRSNAEVLRRTANGMDLARRWSDTWVVDFGVDRSEGEASLFAAPFQHVRQVVQPTRALSKRKSYRERWWLFAEPTPKMRERIAPLPRYIATPIVAKYRLFTWIDRSVLPDHALIVTARADDANLGILHSRFHELWSLRLGTSLEDRPRYTPTTCFETFPFPSGLTPADTAHQRTESLASGALIPASLPGPVLAHAVAIGGAAHRLVALRDGWLNPPEWTERLPEVVPLGMSASPYPDRIGARPGFEAQLAKRTLTNLYNERPAWLHQAHEDLDAAVAAAYGWHDWSPAMPDEEILRRLLALNQQRASAN